MLAAYDYKDEDRETKERLERDLEVVVLQHDPVQQPPHPRQFRRGLMPLPFVTCNYPEGITAIATLNYSLSNWVGIGVVCQASPLVLAQVDKLFGVLVCI